MGRNDPILFTVVIDSREQQPYSYPGAVVKGLPTGDYSALGYENRVAIERKSKADAYASLGSGRARFERELQRLAKLDYAAIVIESSLEDFLEPPAFTRMNPKSAVNSIIAWSVKYRVGVFFAGNRTLARSLIYRLLEKFVRYANEGIYGGQKSGLEGL
jgi:ERCC4-type nuclease